jgi:hypothetical protein
MNDCQIVTVCSHYPPQDYYCLKEYVTSLRDEPIIVLGQEPNSYKGLGSKPKLLFKAIKEGVIKKEYTLFTDCWDFVFAISPQHLFTSYLQWFPDLAVVVSSEKNCFPIDLKKEYDNLAEQSILHPKYRYLNSGMIVGKTEDIFKCLEAMDLESVPDDHYDHEKQQQINPNDQFLWQQIFLKQPVNIRFDYNQILCNTLHSVTLDELSFEPQGILNKETGHVSCAYHFNGNAKTEGLREPILKHLKLL